MLALYPCTLRMQSIVDTELFSCEFSFLGTAKDGCVFNFQIWWPITTVDHCLILNLSCLKKWHLQTQIKTWLH